MNTKRIVLTALYLAQCFTLMKAAESSTTATASSAKATSKVARRQLSVEEMDRAIGTTVYPLKYVKDARLVYSNEAHPDWDSIIRDGAYRSLDAMLRGRKESAILLGDKINEAVKEVIPCILPVHERLNRLERVREHVANRLDEIDAFENFVNESLTDINTQIAATKESIAAVIASISRHDERINGLDTRLTSCERNIETRFTSLNALVVGLTLRTDKLESLTVKASQDSASKANTADDVD